MHQIPSPEFASLGLDETILKALLAVGYENPTPIQLAAIPPLLAGRDLLGTAQTGTGKTAAFALPILHRLRANPRRPAPRGARVLVVAPTRELAMQIDQSLEAYGRYAGISHACVFGGVGKTPQVRALSRGVDVLVATPGRLLDLQGEGQLRLDAVETVVLDEADRMLDMGFIHDIKRVIALLPKQRQTLLFSATMPRDIEELARGILRDPARVAVAPDRPTAERVDHRVVHVEKAEKRFLITELLRGDGVSRALVFARTRHGADRLVRHLGKEGIGAEAIHADKSQGARVRALGAFKDGSVRVLVATDLAARGIDVDEVSHVFNYELPMEPETYVHRIGRTARAGASGAALSLCEEAEKPQLKAIERLLGSPIPREAGAPMQEALRVARLRAREAEASRPEGGDRPASAPTGLARRPAQQAGRRPLRERSARPGGRAPAGHSPAGPGASGHAPPGRSPGARGHHGAAGARRSA